MKRSMQFATLGWKATWPALAALASPPTRAQVDGLIDKPALNEPF